MKTSVFPTRILGLLALLVFGTAGRAQWITQTFELKAGWNAIYTHVDASHTTIYDMVPGVDHPIEEVWMWNPPFSTTQFVESPLEPVAGGSQWTSWEKGAAGTAALQRLIGNRAYLVRVHASFPTYSWVVKGKPMSPQYTWTTSGLNFIGFPTPTNPPPSFETFLTPAPALEVNTEIFRYVGGELSTNDPTNPFRVFAFNTTPVTRGEAFWIRSFDNYNDYFGPFELTAPSVKGLDFKENIGRQSLRLRNATGYEITVTAELRGSDSPPAGQPAIVNVRTPLLVRGAMNTTNLTFGFHDLSAGPKTWTLKPKGKVGSEVEIIVGVNRSAMTGSPGEIFAGVLRFTDSYSLSMVELGVSARVPSTAGLWVGSAAVDQVGHYLKSYQTDENGVRVTATNGQYIVTSTNLTLGSVAKPFPLRLILHSDGTNSSLLQRVYLGTRFETNPAVAISESLLDASSLAAARRISAIHLPWSSANAPWPCPGVLRQGTGLSTTVTLNHNDQKSNPFLHTYHPDHDNLDFSFKNAVPQGSESYTVRRDLSFYGLPPGSDFTSLTSGGQSLFGQYSEVVTVLGLAKAGNTFESRQFEVRGYFSLNRINDIAKLTTTP